MHGKDDPRGGILGQSRIFTADGNSINGLSGRQQ